MSKNFRHLEPASGADTGCSGIGFVVEDLEEVEEADHLERFGNEVRRLDQLHAASDFRGFAQRVYKGADGRRIEVRHGLEVENEKNMSARESVRVGVFKLVKRFAAEEPALRLESADASIFFDIEVHEESFFPIPLYRRKQAC